MKVFLAALLGVIVIAGAYFMWMRPPASAENEAKEPSLSTMTIKESTDSYEIDVEYPQFGIPAIDEQIRNDIDDALAEFKAVPPNPPESATPVNGFDGSYEDVFIGPDIVGAKLVLSQYTGGAHPMTIFSGVNFDRATGKRLGLDDALALIGKSVQEVSEQSTKELKEKLGSDIFAEGADTNPENYSSFLVSADKVTFIFQAYQVAAYAAGPQQVSFARIK